MAEPLTFAAIETIFGVPFTTGLRDVLYERAHHARKGYDAAHDDDHGIRPLVDFATPYLSEFYNRCPVYPGRHWQERENTQMARRALIKAASVLLAAVDKLDRQIEAERVEREGK